MPLRWTPLAVLQVPPPPRDGGRLAAWFPSRRKLEAAVMIKMRVSKVSRRLRMCWSFSINWGRVRHSARCSRLLALLSRSQSTTLRVRTWSKVFLSYQSAAGLVAFSLAIKVRKSFLENSKFTIFTGFALQIQQRFVNLCVDLAKSDTNFEVSPWCDNLFATLSEGAKERLYACSH